MPGRGRPRRGGDRSGARAAEDRARSLEIWKPKTTLGRLVAEGKVKTMDDAIATRLPIREPEIVDILLPSLSDEVVDINMVQRMTDSGRRVKFAITAVVGNSDGYVGIGREKGKEVGPTIKRAIAKAKLNILQVKRGCGSWECGCGKPHSLPYAVKGKSGSVHVEFKPAPQGISLAVGDVAKSVLRLAGIKDAWGIIKGGHTKTTVNYALASFEALKANSTMKVDPSQVEKLHIVSGSVGTPASQIPLTGVSEVVIEEDVVVTGGDAAAALAPVPAEGTATAQPAAAPAPATAAAAAKPSPAEEPTPEKVEKVAVTTIKATEHVKKVLKKIEKTKED